MPKSSLKVGGVVLVMSVVLGLVVGFLFPQSEPRIHSNRLSHIALLMMLTNPSIWGSDFVHLLPYLPAYQNIGERTLIIFPTDIEGATVYDSYDAAKEKAEELARSLAANNQSRSLPFHVSPILLGIGGYPRIDWMGSFQLFHDSLTIQRVKWTLGTPDTITQTLEDEKFERRAPILTQYGYAGGVVIFVESDMHEGKVDRILLDLPGIISVLGETKK